MADERPSIMTGLFRDRDSAERAYGTLSSRGYGKDDVSLLMSEETRNRHFPKTDSPRTELGTRAAKQAAASLEGTERRLSSAGTRLGWIACTKPVKRDRGR